MKKSILVAISLMMAGSASLSGALARTHQRGIPQQASSDQMSQGQTYASSAPEHYRAVTGANPYTHQFPSTDGSDR